MDQLIQQLGLVGAILMPFWNIPLMVRIVRRKTSEDISLAWLFGIWGCILAMLPSSLVSTDPILRGFGVTNGILFSAVVVVVLMYRRPKR